MADLDRLANQVSPIGMLAFVQSERRHISPEGLEKWWPSLGPHAPDDHNIRYAVFAWDLMNQGWGRAIEFSDATSAADYAVSLHTRLFARWQLGDMA